jgi:hypothetical protein
VSNTATLTIGCALGPCIHSRERGGTGCKLCDVTAKLPQRQHMTIVARATKQRLTQTVRPK